jgi:hypothetical protein
MSNIDKYKSFIAEQVRKGSVAGLRSGTINEEISDDHVHQHAGAMHAAKTLRDEDYGDDDAKAHAKKIEADVAAKHGKEGVARLREKSKAAVKELHGHIRAADRGSAEAQKKVDDHPIMKHADKHLEGLY